jgi:GntR family transcriptional regulator, phosphonate transport system regulatory protein
MNLIDLRPVNGAPIYLRIADALEVHIRRHHCEGDPLPTEQALAQQFGVNKHTLRRAVDELVQHGLVERRRGVGLFVLDPTINYRIEETTRFTTKIEELGRTPVTRVLTRRIVMADDSVAECLGIAPGTEAVAIETLRLVDNKPFCLISHFLPVEPFRILVETYVSGSLHKIIEQEFGRKLKRGRTLITAILPTAEDAKALGIGRLQPVLRAKSVNRDASSTAPVEYAVTRFRSDRVELQVGA